MNEDLKMLYKGQQKEEKDSSEIGIVTSLSPFKFTINGVEYSEENFTIYVPTVNRIKQYEEILAVTPDHVTGKATVDIGDLELIPDLYEMKFKVGDLIDVTDRGDTFIVHSRLVKLGETQELYTPTHRGGD